MEAEENKDFSGHFTCVRSMWVPANATMRYTMASSVAASMALAARHLSGHAYLSCCAGALLAWLLQWAALLALRTHEEIHLRIPAHIRADRAVVSLAAISLPAAFSCGALMLIFRVALDLLRSVA